MKAAKQSIENLKTKGNLHFVVADYVKNMESGNYDVGLDSNN